MNQVNEWSEFAVLAYVSLALLVLVSYLAYLHIASYEVGEWERRRLQEGKLRLAHLFLLLESRDVRVLMERPASRSRLFRQWSESIRKDIVDILRDRKLSFASFALVACFFLGYYGLRAKSYFFSGRRDLAFLSGLELALLRSLD